MAPSFFEPRLELGGAGVGPAQSWARLAPPSRPARQRAVFWAVLVAVLLHLAAAALLLWRVPLSVHPAAPPAPPREAEVEMVQDNMANEADTENQGGKTPPALPPSAAPVPPLAAQPLPQGGGPHLVTAPNGETPPPGALPSLTPGQTAAPAPPSPASPSIAPPAPQANPVTPPLPAAPAQSGDAQNMEIRLSESGDDGEGASGGTATTPATPDPHIHNRKPAYPSEAVLRHQQGEVDMYIHVGPDGNALAVTIANSSGSASLDAAAVAAVRKWKFKPAIQNGVPVASDVPQAMNFELVR